MAEVLIYTHIYHSNYWDLITSTTKELAKLCKDMDCPMPAGAACPFGEAVDCQDVRERDWLNFIGEKEEQNAN